MREKGWISIISGVAMREIFKQFAYGRTQTAFSEGGLPIGAGLEDLGKGLRSQVATMYGTREKGVRYLEMAEGYVTRLALDENDEIIGYEFVNLGKFMEALKKGIDYKEAFEKNTGVYGRFGEAAKIIDPRHKYAAEDRNMVTFENYDRRIERIKACIATSGFKNLEEVRDFTLHMWQKQICPSLWTFWHSLLRISRIGSRMTHDFKPFKILGNHSRNWIGSQKRGLTRRGK